MKKVILNQPILDLDNSPLTTRGTKVAVDSNGNIVRDENNQPIREVIPLKFGQIVLDALVRSITKTEQEAKDRFQFATLLSNHVKSEVGGEELEISDEEFDLVNNVISKQPLIIKARFIQMVESLN